MSNRRVQVNFLSLQKYVFKTWRHLILPDKMWTFTAMFHCNIWYVAVLSWNYSVKLCIAVNISLEVTVYRTVAYEHIEVLAYQVAKHIFGANLYMASTDLILNSEVINLVRWNLQCLLREIIILLLFAVFPPKLASQTNKATLQVYIS